MAKSKRVKEVEMKEEDSSSVSMSEDDMINKEIQVNFTAVTPNDSDFHGIQRLLQQLFLKAHINLSELSELIIKQNYVCSILQQDASDNEESEDDDSSEDENFGMISVINITEKKELSCIDQVHSFLIDHCKQAGSEGQKIQSILEDPQNQIGLILSERLANIPPKVALPLYENLWLDMQKAVEKKMKYQFSFYLLISKIYKQTKKKKNKGEDIIYTNAEEELFSEETELQFEYSVADEIDSGLGGQWSDDEDEWTPYRKIMLIPASKWDVIMQKLKSELS